MKLFPFSFLFTVVSTTALMTVTSASANTLNVGPAYYPTRFYTQVDQGLKDGALKNELFKILSSAHVPGAQGHDTLVESCDGQRGCYRYSPMSYKQARSFVLGYLDLIEDHGHYALKDVYCEALYTDKDFPDGEGPHPGAPPAHTVFNVEHTWPQSRFSSKFSKNLQKPDLHILYGVSQKANSSRQNVEFADVQTEQHEVCPSVRRGWVRGNTTDVFFEPPDSHKGNVARAIFYFSVRYKMPVSPTEEASLRRWHKLDPVDAHERSRHEEIFKAQKDRNPFIDHPELVDLISDF